MAIDKITKIDDNFVLTGTHVEVPSGTTAERPSGPENGYFRYNTTLGSLEFYNGDDGNWVSTNLIPSITSLTGNINDTYEATLKFETTNTTDNVTVVFRNSSNVEIAEVTNVDTTTVPFYVDIPSAVTSAVSSGDTVKVSVQNQDGTPSDSVSKTVVAAPTGGTIRTYTQSGSAYRSHTFTSSDNFINYESLTVDELIVSGGGGGAAGYNEAGGGGGAGGMVEYTGVTLTASTRTVTVGAGGSGLSGGTDGTTAGNGGSSDITSDNQGGLGTVVGGGGGGQQVNNGADGGSGGGGGGIDSGEGPTSGGSGTSGQGNDGGGSAFNQGDMGGGGGGAGQAGQAVEGNSAGGGDGGDGSTNSYSTGSNVTYAGGGGGGCNTGTAGAGGSGGGGDGGLNANGDAGSANTGAGGGGGDGGSSITGGNGGSGIVVIRYKTDQVSA